MAMKVLACYSMKGGVGKTATAVNIAWLAAAAGLRTLLIDLDPQAAASYYFRVKAPKKNWADRFFKDHEYLVSYVKQTEYPNLNVVPAHLGFRDFDVLLENMSKRRKRLGNILDGLKDHYELIILDCPPGISNLAESIFTAADQVLVPVIPTTLSERNFVQLLDFFKHHEYPTQKLRPFFSMVQAQKSLHVQTMEGLRAHDVGFLQASIPFTSDVEKMGEHQAPVTAFAPQGKGGLAFAALWAEIAPELTPERSHPLPLEALETVHAPELSVS